MNALFKDYCRFYQKGMWLAMWLLPWNQTKGQFSGQGAVEKSALAMAEKGHKKALLVTDDGLYKLGMADTIAKAFEAKNISVEIYHDVVPNPTVENVENGLKQYKDNSCDMLIALGGGSAMDCCKAIGARIARPNKPVAKMKGVLKVLKKIPDLLAIPTTSGTGSEATVAAVISNHETNEKYAINDTALIPRYVVFDPELTVGLPKHITSTTGMDALTHAVEGYIGGSNTSKTKKDSIDAVQLINKYLKTAYDDGKNLEARNQMQHAAYLAGRAFTRSYVGYVHAVAHTLGGFYGIPHGLANAVTLPYVLKAYGSAAYKKLAELADCISLNGANDEEKAKAFIGWIEDMNAYMNIPTKITDKNGNPIIKKEDIPEMISHALREANPLYPCPVVWGKEDLEKIYIQLT